MVKNMKIAIIISGNAAKAPYLSYYERLFKEQRIEYDLICWNRKLINELGTISYNVKQSEDKGFIYRFISYVRYRNFVVQILMRNNYDKVIVSTVAIGILIYPYLLRNYKRNFVLDIRDYSVIIRFMSGHFCNLVANSAFTVISSSGYSAWLPKNGIYIKSHNFPFQATNGSIEPLVDRPNLSKEIKKLHISNIGYLRDFNANNLLIRAFKERKDCYLSFIGSGPAYSKLKSFVDQKSISNVHFHGPYNKSEEVGLLATTTMINNFTNDDINSRTLTTNRFYLSVVLALPMIVREGTYQAELCKKYNLGCVIDPETAIPEQLLAYVASFDYENYNQGRNSFLELVKRDTELLNKMLWKFIGKDVNE